MDQRALRLLTVLMVIIDTIVPGLSDSNVTVCAHPSYPTSPLTTAREPVLQYTLYMPSSYNSRKVGLFACNSLSVNHELWFVEITARGLIIQAEVMRRGLHDSSNAERITIEARSTQSYNVVMRGKAGCKRVIVDGAVGERCLLYGDAMR
jgi:hypothetical protein